MGQCIVGVRLYRKVFYYDQGSDPSWRSWTAPPRAVEELVGTSYYVGPNDLLVLRYRNARDRAVPMKCKTEALRIVEQERTQVTCESYERLEWFVETLKETE